LHQNPPAFFGGTDSPMQFKKAPQAEATWERHNGYAPVLGRIRGAAGDKNPNGDAAAGEAVCEKFRIFRNASNVRGILARYNVEFHLSCPLGRAIVRETRDSYRNECTAIVLSRWVGSS
jgi:hypothetical protein